MCTPKILQLKWTQCTYIFTVSWTSRYSNRAVTNSDTTFKKFHMWLACKNRACGHIKFDCFFILSWIKTFLLIIDGHENFYSFKVCYFTNILLQHWEMTHYVTGCSSRPHALLCTPSYIYSTKTVIFQV